MSNTPEDHSAREMNLGCRSVGQTLTAVNTMSHNPMALALLKAAPPSARPKSTARRHENPCRMMRTAAHRASTHNAAALLSLLTAPLINKNCGKKATNEAASRATSRCPAKISSAKR
jgi:hypothetical protein